MEASLNYDRFRFKDTSVNVTVPNNDIARLMYYLDCVSSVLNYNGLKAYTNFNNYYNLSEQDMRELLELINIFNPKILMDVGVFMKAENLDNNNAFIQITNESMKIHADQEIVIGGIVTRALKIMLFKSNWAINYYYNPKQRLTQRLYQPQPVFLPFPYPQTNNIPYYTPPTYYQRSYQNYNSDDELCCCAIF